MTGPPRVVFAGPAEVHVWWVDLDRMNTGASAILAPDERGRADRLRRQRDRERWIGSRAALRQILATYVGAAPEKLQFAHADHWGKPALKGPSPIQFSVTHSGDRAALAIAWRREVGIDLERIDPALDVASLLGVACTPAERQRIEALPLTERIKAFLTLWTLKEAYLKATGVGLSREPRSMEIALSPAGRAVVRDPHADPSRSRWHLCLLDPGPGWVAALAVAGTEPRLAEFQWPTGPRTARSTVAIRPRFRDA